MSQVLEVSQTEIKEAVRRDRCDWLAAIYNLLIDQPEGRNILQQMIAGDPNDQLVDAAHYQGSTEHLRLSQAGVLGREGERGGRKREVGERERGKRGREGRREGGREKLYLSFQVWFTFCHSFVILCHDCSTVPQTLSTGPLPMLRAVKQQHTDTH